MKMAALGYVNCATAKNDDCLWGVLAAARDNKYNPNPVVAPESMQVRAPGMMPAEASAWRELMNTCGSDDRQELVPVGD